MSGGELADLAWDRLRGEKTGDSDLGMPSFPLQISTEAGPARLAVGTADEPRLLLPLAAGEDFPDIGDTPGLLLLDIVLLTKGKPVRFVDMTCRDAGLEDVFRDLVSSILKRIGEKASVSDAVEGAVREYRALLKRRTQSAATLEKVLGLLGELYVLNQLLDIAPAAESTWMGPSGARHDFRRAEMAMEVKTSIRSQTSTVEISGLQQLQAPSEGKLLLAALFVEADPAGVITVPRLVDSILTKAQDVARVGSILASAGYDLEAPKPFEQFAFSLSSFDLYRVEGDFPRLTSEDLKGTALPLGVSQVTYRLDLAAAQSHRISPGSQSQQLQRFLGL